MDTTRTQKTTVQALEEHAQEGLAIALIAERFPDAIKKSGHWFSSSVKAETAKGLEFELRSDRTGLVAEVKIFIELWPSGCDSVRVYAHMNYTVETNRIKKLLEDNSALVLKEVNEELKLQEMIFE